MAKFKNQDEKDLAGVLYNRGTKNAKQGNLTQAIEDFTTAGDYEKKGAAVW